MRILIADDEELSRRSIANFLQGQLAHQVEQCENGAEAWEEFKAEPFPVVISDIRMPVMDGIELLQKIANSSYAAQTKVILITGFADVNTAVEAMRHGAHDYLRKPINIREVAQIIANLENSTETRQMNKQKLSDKTVTLIDIKNFGKMVVATPEDRKVLELALKLHGNESMPVLIQGATGTGKEVVARLIHHGKDGVKEPFVAVNCAAIAPSLFESELFGYEPGAFTGASKTGWKGKMEQASGGTLLLDEIGEMPIGLQPKLLRALETREIVRIGGTRAVPCEFRLIAATNRNLAEQVEAGAFRSDLYYRLNMAQIFLSSLRERPATVKALAELFLMELQQAEKTRMKTIHPEALKLLESYCWPGNIRELKNVIARISFLYDTEVLLPEHLSSLLTGEVVDTHVVENYMSDSQNMVLPDDGLDLKQLELRLVKAALEKNEGNKTKTAEYLCLTRRELDSRLRKLS